MTTNTFKYDVAISFLYEDLALAQALKEKVINGLEVFFFPGAQEVLAGTDGLESMREPFRHQSRLNVVLYRPKWGHTPSTAVEEIAIRESCLDNSFRNIFVYVIENTGVLPKWLPDTHVYFSSAYYTLDEAVGAIKARFRTAAANTSLSPHCAKLNSCKRNKITSMTVRSCGRNRASQRSNPKCESSVAP